MDRLAAVKRLIESLSAQELAEFREWFYGYLISMGADSIDPQS